MKRADSNQKTLLALFFVLAGLLVLLILSATASTQTEEIKRLTQHNAILEHRVRQLEEALKTREAEGSAEKPSDSR